MAPKFHLQVLCPDQLHSLTRTKFVGYRCQIQSIDNTCNRIDRLDVSFNFSLQFALNFFDLIYLFNQKRTVLIEVLVKVALRLNEQILVLGM